MINKSSATYQSSITCVDCISFPLVLLRSMSSDRNSMRSNDPYGVWVISGQAKVFFNRLYQPLYGGCRPCAITNTVYFYHDGTKPWESKANYSLYIKKLAEYN